MPTSRYSYAVAVLKGMGRMENALTSANHTASVFLSKESEWLNYQLQMTSGSQKEVEGLKPWTTAADAQCLYLPAPYGV